MKRQWKLLLCLALVLATLSSCAGSPEPQPVFEEATQYLGPVTATHTPAPVATADTSGTVAGGDVGIFANNPYVVDPNGFTPEDALGEEDYIDDGVYEDGLGEEGGADDGSGDSGGLVYPDYSYVDENATPYPYAGSTPIPLDPVDMPSPTPQQVDFFYVPYVISNLGLTFEGPSQWDADESIPEQFTLTEPEAQIKDGQPGVIRVYAIPVNSDFSASALRTEVLDRLDAIGSTNFTEWKPSNTATRHLMGSEGVYANYSGTMANGVRIGGRIHCVTIDRVLYCIEIAYPLSYKSEYEDVFAKMRSTIKRQ